MTLVALTKAHVAGYVRQLAIEMRTLAVKVKWQKLADLLELVALEADKECVPIKRGPRTKRR